MNSISRTTEKSEPSYFAGEFNRCHEASHPARQIRPAGAKVFTTKPVGEGTGLGLDISFRIVVNKHNGDIQLHSAPGDTRFTVWLPLHRRASDIDESDVQEGKQ